MVLTRDMKGTIRLCFEEKGWRGARLVKEFPNLEWNRQSINRFIQKLENTGSDKRQDGSGRPGSLSEQQMEDIEHMICSQENKPGTHLSQRKIAKTLNVTRGSVRRHLQTRKLKAFKRIISPPMSQAVRMKRKTRANNLYKMVSKHDVKKMVFTDEKDFTLEVPTNRQNNRVYASSKKTDISPGRLYHEKSRFSRKVMVSAGVSWRGKTDIFFLETQTAKVDSVAYINLLKDQMLPACEELYPGGYILQQDGAPSHRSRVTQEFLADKCEFISKDKWPPNSPDLSPLDYCIWSALEEKV